MLGQFVSQMTVRICLGGQRLLGRIEVAATGWSRRRWRLAGVAALEAVVTLLCLTVGAEAVLLTLTVFLLVPAGVFVATVPLRILVSFLTWPTIAILSLVLLLPFGREVALANILLDVTAETTPPSSWTVHLFPAPTARELGVDTVPLMHSVVYENPTAVAFVADWIARKDK